MVVHTTPTIIDTVVLIARVISLVEMMSVLESSALEGDDEVVCRGAVVYVVAGCDIVSVSGVNVVT